jgi:hypothetical protein
MKTAAMFEKVGRTMPGMIAGGAFMVEASKLIYPPKGRLVRSIVKRQKVPQGVTASTILRF